MLLGLGKAKQTHCKGSSKGFSPILKSWYRTRKHNLLDPRISHASETRFLLPQRVPTSQWIAPQFPSRSLPTAVAVFLWGSPDFSTFQGLTSLSKSLCCQTAHTTACNSPMSQICLHPCQISLLHLFLSHKRAGVQCNRPLFGCRIDLLKHMDR